MNPSTVQTLFVTMRRGFAGTREAHCRILKSLGFRWRQQTLELANTPNVRGAINKVKHMVAVETDVMRQRRLAAEAAAKAPRPPVQVQHA